MKMIFRWFGENNDNISLNQIRQIPGVEGIAWALHNMMPGEEWALDDMLAVKKQCGKYNLNNEVVESVNIHDSIKLGLPDRDKYIEAYISTMKKLSQIGVKVICYNFMPAFDWIRTDLYKPLGDGSNAMFYEKAKLENITIKELIDRQLAKSGTFTIPGWEPERLRNIDSLLDSYLSLNEEELRSNLKYFLGNVIPVAEENDIKMAIHPDDPPWPLFGLPRLVSSKEKIQKLLKLVDSPYNGLTLCSGSLGTSKENNIPALINEFADRIHFAHIRNVRLYDNGDFIETSHRSCDGSLDIYKIMKALHDNNFKGYIRPDHGRHLWGEEKECRPGYSLYDRAMGIMYLLGIWDTMGQMKIDKEN